MSPSLDELTARAIGFIETIARRAVRVATAVLVAVTAVVAATTMLGAFLLGGGARVFFLLLALVFGTIAVGFAWIGRWRLGIAGRQLPALTGEVRQLLASDEDARASVDALVVDAHVVTEDGDEVIVADSDPVASRTGGRDSWFDSGRAFAGLRTLAGNGIDQFGTLASVVGGARTYPILAFWSLAIAFGFAVLGAVFALALLVRLL